MDFEDYVNFMAKKCQLAAATAVIKNKPPGASNDDYIAQLREKINEKNDEFVDLDLICTSDFVINDNDFEFNDDDDSRVNLDDTASEIIVTITTDTHCSEINNPAFTNDVEIEDTASIDLIQDFKDQAVVKMNRTAFIEIAPLGSSHRSEDSLNDILNTLRQIERHTQVDQDQLTNNFTQDMFDENSQIISPHYNNRTIENMAKQDLPFINLNIASDRDDDLFIDERLKANIAKNIRPLKEKDKIEENYETNEFSLDLDMEIPSNVIDRSLNEKHESNKDFVKEKAAIVSKNIERELAKNREQNRNNYNIYNEEDITQKLTVVNTAFDTQKTILYTLHGYTETSQISQSQCQNVEISNKFIFGNKNKTSVNKIENNNDEFPAEVAYETTEDRVNDGNKQFLAVDSTQIQYIIDNSGKTYAVLQSHAVNDNSKATVANNDDTEVEEDILQPKETNFVNSHNQKPNLHSANKNRPQIELNTVAKNLEVHEDSNTQNTECNPHENKNVHSITDSYETAEDTEMSPQETVVPFKVVRELSKIKTFLKRRERSGSTDGFSSDSGYKSDSQSSYTSAHLSENWLHQSGYCLYDYIVHCPLVAVTQEIVTEISKVLGRLVDRLHEEEKYPKFVEELLEKIEKLLRELYEGSCSSDDVLLQKDELIQRLLLLNKSTHILKFTIDKITAILEKTYTQLVSEETLHELTNIEETENLNHIFHLLETIIRRFVKEKENFTTQSTQNSQDSHKVLRKSSISDIWRKKWNPSCKEIRNTGSQDKGGCLDKCGGVLNKIIVECMDGYSLISFAALQCFNLLQN